MEPRDAARTSPGDAASPASRILRWGLIVATAAAVALAAGIVLRWRARVEAGRVLFAAGFELEFEPRPQFGEGWWSDLRLSRPLQSAHLHGGDYAQQAPLSGMNRVVLAALARFPECKSLDLGGCVGVDYDFLIQLQSLPSLEEIDLCHCPVDDRGCAALAQLTSLRYVSLADCRRVGDAGAAQLASLPRLEKLVLLATDVTSDYLDRPFAKSLKVLDLRFTDATDLRRIGPAEWDELTRVCVDHAVERYGGELVQAPAEPAAKKVSYSRACEHPPFRQRRRRFYHVSGGPREVEY